MTNIRKSLLKLGKIFKSQSTSEFGRGTLLSTIIDRKDKIGVNVNG